MLTTYTKKLRHATLPLAVIACALMATGWWAPVARAESPLSKELKLKAAFLFNFVQFVDWPPAAFADATTPITIGVVGTDPFGPYLPKLVQGETVKHRSLIVKRVATVADMKACHLLFISQSEKGRATQILAGLGDASVLTVGEMDGFARGGGDINFFIEDDKLRFAINPAAARRRGLKIGSQLLKLAKIVGPAAGKEEE